jgi:hypothetical protein
MAWSKAQRSCIIPLPRQLPKGEYSNYYKACIYIRIEVMNKGGRFEGGSVVEARPNLTL